MAQEVEKALVTKPSVNHIQRFSGLSLTFNSPEALINTHSKFVSSRVNCIPLWWGYGYFLELHNVLHVLKKDTLLAF